MDRRNLNKRRMMFVLLSILSALLIVFLVSISDHWKNTNAGPKAVENASGNAWIGKQAEPFTLPGIDGKPVNIATDIGKRPVVLVFYRGVW